MTMHNDHHLTETEDAAFDATLKIGGLNIYACKGPDVSGAGRNCGAES